MSESAWVRATAPASLSNLGPGFDALGLCIDTHVDSVEARRTTDSGIVIEEVTGLYREIPIDPAKNTAGVAAEALMRATGAPGGLRIRINKGIPLGSGIGGSAASAAAGACAAAALLGVDQQDDLVVEAAITGEAFASGSRHGDNLLPSLLGGFIATTPGRPEHYERIAVTAQLSLAVVLPSLQVFTQAERSGFPEQVPLRDAVVNAAGSARIVAAIVNGSWAELGRSIMVDEIIEPRRSKNIPGFDAAVDAALRAGAYGAALSGSGPAIFAVCTHDAHARRVSNAMADALGDVGLEAYTFVAHPSNAGTIVDPVL
jgi:homoserine kinase